MKIQVSSVGDTEIHYCVDTQGRKQGAAYTFLVEYVGSNGDLISEVKDMKSGVTYKKRIASKVPLEAVIYKNNLPEMTQLFNGKGQVSDQGKVIKNLREGAWEHYEYTDNGERRVSRITNFTLGNIKTIDGFTVTGKLQSREYRPDGSIINFYGSEDAIKEIEQPIIPKNSNCTERKKVLLDTMGQVRGYRHVQLCPVEGAEAKVIVLSELKWDKQGNLIEERDAKGKLIIPMGDRSPVITFTIHGKIYDFSLPSPSDNKVIASATGPDCAKKGNAIGFVEGQELSAAVVPHLPSR